MKNIDQTIAIIRNECRNMLSFAESGTIFQKHLAVAISARFEEVFAQRQKWSEKVWAATNTSPAHICDVIFEKEFGKGIIGVALDAQWIGQNLWLIEKVA